ncbi:unnamed protein product [Ectocarpus sp. 12 AP-2014]
MAVVLAAYVFLSSSCSGFIMVPANSSPLSARRRAAVRPPASSSRRLDRCKGGSWLGERPAAVNAIVLQATTDDNSEQVREQPTQEASLAAARQEAARSKQLNIACNDVVRTILDGNPTNEKERAEALRQRLIAQKDDLVSPEDDMSALFFDNLLLVCEHELHPDIGILRGQYGKAWNTILHYIEDAGWQLTDPPFSISG